MTDHREMRTIADADGQVEALLAILAQGPHTVATATTSLACRFAGVTAADVAEGVDGLDRLGMLENADRDGELTGWQRDRYYTNLMFFQSFASLDRPAAPMQRRLLTSNVLFLGVGGLGSTVLMHLIGAGIGRCTLVDHDVVEERNFSRQFVYRHADIGRSKVDRAAEWVREFSPGTAVRAIDAQIGSPDDVGALLDDVDLVVGAIDTPPIKIASWINSACVAAGVPHVRGGMGIQSSYVSVDPGRSACVECHRTAVLREADQPGSVGAKWRLFERLELVNRGVGPVAGQIGAVIAMEALRYLTGFAAPVAAGVVHTFDLGVGGAETLVRWDRHPDCPVCPTAGAARESNPAAA